MLDKTAIKNDNNKSEDSGIYTNNCDNSNNNQYFDTINKNILIMKKYF